jgi:topoisomerase-4 subunit A
MTKHSPPPSPENSKEVALRQALEERYLAYALSTITSRALPDVRDGLKPVHRRLLFAMRQLRLDPDQGFKKCARVVGDVIGRYHPHGDQAVYDALARLAQDFAVRYPLVEGQGNFGNIDGDGPAAMRYTEARLTEVAQLLLEGLDENAVDFNTTYDGEDSEPQVLAGCFPNLLANGASGIAVGMATSIPPHNAGELCAAALHLIKTPNARVETLLKYVPGPDFPTGGIIVDTQESIAEAYRTGRGSFRLRARWHVEEGARGAYSIIVTEVPYGVQKARLIERLAELVHTKKLTLVDDIRDESAEDVRLVIEPKSRSVAAETLMEQLFRQSELETRIPLNMNVLIGGRVPKVCNLAEVLQHFLGHQREVLQRISRFKLDRGEKRLEILEGYLIAYLNLDAVIKIVRGEDEPKPVLMKHFKLSEAQAEAILNMRLRSLRKLEEKEIRGEHAALTAECKNLKALLRSPEKQWQAIADKLKEVKERFGPGSGKNTSPPGARRTSFQDLPEAVEIAPETLIEREAFTIILSQKGWIRAFKGHMDDLKDIKFREGDAPGHVLYAETTDKILLFASNGRFYTLGADKLPSGRGNGEPVRLMLDLTESDEVVAMRNYEPGGKFLIAASSGHGFIVPADEVVASKRSGKQVMSMAANAQAKICALALGDWLAVIGDNRKLLLFKASEINEMTKGRGVLLQRYREGGLADACLFEGAKGLRDASGRTWELKELKDWQGARAQAGRLPPKGFSRQNKFG